MNESYRELRRLDGSLVPLTTAEFNLLCVFVKNPLRSLSRAEVLQLAPPRVARDSGRSVDVIVSRLRRKIERDPREPVLIKTVRDEGYLFAAIVHGESPHIVDTI